MTKRKMSIVTLTSAIILNTHANSWISDPSKKIPNQTPYHQGERYRIVADFNADGIQDMALSFDTKLFGTGGGHFDLFIQNEKGLFQKQGEFFTSPSSVSIEKVGNKTRIWTFSPGGGSAGTLAYLVLSDGKLSAPKSIKISPGDSGTSLGNAVYDAVFKNSTHPIFVEKSEANNGTITWKKVYLNH